MGDPVWVTDQRYVVLGTVFRILSQDDAFATELDRLVTDFEASGSGARARNTFQVLGSDKNISAYHDCRKLTDDSDRYRALNWVVAGINRAAIEQCPLFAVHSGVVALGNRIVAIPAASGEGKTTLTGAFVSTGWSFISDEALVFDDTGEVLTYPKPLALSPWSAEKLGLPAVDDEMLVTAEDLGSNVGPGGQLTDLILSEYAHADPRLTPLPRSEAVTALIKYSFNHFKDPGRAFRISTDVARVVNVWRLEYGDPLEGARLVSDVIG